MTLGQKQELFASSLSLLIQYAITLGYTVRLGHVERCEDCPIGSASSLHKSRLAVDLHLFRGGEYLSSTQDHRQLGTFWESLGELHSWGGRFDDGNHYSIRHGGMR